MSYKQYPSPGNGPTYTGETFQTSPNSYIISIGVEGSEAPPFKGELVETGPFTSREGIIDWVQEEYDRLSALGGTSVAFHFNNASILTAGLEQIIGKNGATLNIGTGQFSPHSDLPKPPDKALSAEISLTKLLN